MSALTGMDTITTVLILLAAIGAIVITNRAFTQSRHDKESPFLPSIIPYVGHLVGLFWYKNKYYTKLRQCEHPIYSLALPGSRLYVVNSPDVVLSLQRQPKIISFWFIEAKFTARLGGMSAEASKKLEENLRTDHERSLLIRGLKATHQVMRPGKALDQMLRNAGDTITVSLDKPQNANERETIDLWLWVRHEITIITTDSIYGSLNPYRDPEVEEAFWDFADNNMMLLAAVLPNILASRAYCGRERVINAMKKYFATNGHQSGSALVRKRFDILTSEMALEDVARFECVNGIALLVNTVPTAFWTIYHTFADSRILKSVREYANAICKVENSIGVVTRTVDFACFKANCVLTAILHESLRYRGSGTGPRYILEDVMLDNRYLLRKGSYLMIPNHEMHFDSRAWGKDVEDFDAWRSIPSRPRPHSGAFRGFGGGVNLCPGQGFATMEILAFVTMLALRYDMNPVAGQWKDPQQDLMNISLAVSPPKAKVLVNMRPTEGSEKGRWAFDL